MFLCYTLGLESRLQVSVCIVKVNQKTAANDKKQRISLHFKTKEKGGDHNFTDQIISGHLPSLFLLYVDVIHNSVQYVETLEARLKEAALKNSALLQENASLRKQMTALEKEVSLLSLLFLLQLCCACKVFIEVLYLMIRMRFFEPVLAGQPALFHPSEHLLLS